MTPTLSEKGLNVFPWKLPGDHGNAFLSLRGLKTVSSTFQDLDFDVSLLPLLSRCYDHGIKKLPNHW